MKRLSRLVAAGLLAPTVLSPLHAATEQGAGDSRHHLEACTKWSEQRGRFGFRNECHEPVALLFVELNGVRRFDRVLQTNERFDIDLPEKTINQAGWLFTACPAGTVPNVPFTAEQQRRIVKGRYECVRP